MLFQPHHPGGVDHAHCDLFLGRVEPRQIGLGADRGEAFGIDGRAVLFIFIGHSVDPGQVVEVDRGQARREAGASHGAPLRTRSKRPSRPSRVKRGRAPRAQPLAQPETCSVPGTRSARRRASARVSTVACGQSGAPGQACVLRSADPGVLMNPGRAVGTPAQPEQPVRHQPHVAHPFQLESPSRAHPGRLPNGAPRIRPSSARAGRSGAACGRGGALARHPAGACAAGAAPCARPRGRLSRQTRSAISSRNAIAVASVTGWPRVAPSARSSSPPVGIQLEPEIGGAVGQPCRLCRCPARTPSFPAGRQRGKRSQQGVVQPVGLIACLPVVRHQDVAVSLDGRIFIQQSQGGQLGQQGGWSGAATPRI